MVSELRNREDGALPERIKYNRSLLTSGLKLQEQTTRPMKESSTQENCVYINTWQMIAVAPQTTKLYIDFSL